MTSTPSARFGVLVPVKPPAFAKSRLSPLGDGTRRELATALAADTVEAALACSWVDVVVAVTDDHLLARALAELGAHVLPDGASDDLNGALLQAAAEVHRRWPGLGVAALCADLPALRPEELGLVLAECTTRAASFLADTAGIGTTLVGASEATSFLPRFGHGSRRTHLDAGLHEIARGDVPSVRQDVDTPDDLAAAQALGVGARTRLVVTGLRL